jgi:hypothetical protein
LTQLHLKAFWEQLQTELRRDDVRRKRLIAGVRKLANWDRIVDMMFLDVISGP